MSALFALVAKHVPEPEIEEGPFRLLATTVEADPFLGRILTGRIKSGEIRPNQSIKALSRDGKVIEQGRVSKVLAFRGLDRLPVDVGGRATLSPWPVWPRQPWPTPCAMLR